MGIVGDPRAGRSRPWAGMADPFAAKKWPSPRAAVQGWKRKHRKRPSTELSLVGQASKAAIAFRILAERCWSNSPLAVRRLSSVRSLT